MVMRWLFLFMLLINAIVFFWYSLQISPEKNGVKSIERQGNELRLLAELDKAQLINKNQSQEQSCQVFSGLSSEVKAQAVVSFMLEQGFDAYIDARGFTKADGYVVKIDVPAELEKRLSVMDLIETHERKLLNEDELGAYYAVNSFVTKNAAAKFAGRLVKLGVRVSVEPVMAETTLYDVSVVETGGRKIPKEIKEVVMENYSLRKIEKKLCEGVAKP